ncbi:uncharacterized protein LOC143886702 [Tasmannia lanceolata]|uniref:uncharacterized protein LOC143886702 n=1 Tax=Tasmannia lanceolata TaxID=3420 RepID=UPI004063F762
MAQRDQAPNMEVFDAYFRRADLDQDGRISGAEAVAFFQLFNLPKHILAQIWMHADQNRTGFLGRTEFYNALKLVTVAQSGRELTPDMVKAALFGPAAAKIPAPQINPVATATPQVNSMAQPGTQMGAVTPNASQNLGFRGPQVLPNAGMNQQFFPSQGNQFMRPSQATTGASSLPMQGPSQGFPGGGSMGGPRPPNSAVSNVSTDWLGVRPGGMQMGAASQAPNRGTTPSMTQGAFGFAPPGPTASLPPRPQASSGVTSVVSPRPQDIGLSSLQPTDKDAKALAVSGNGFSSDSIFGGDVFSATPSQPKQAGPTSTISVSNTSNSSAIAPTTTGPQPTVKQGPLDPLSTLSIGTNQPQQAPPLVKQNQLNAIQSTSGLTGPGVSVGAVGTASSQPHIPWPKITPSAIQTYTKVFVEVDKDRDGKITGEQARNLFLSWRLPREVLKQVWDLSDQDNDSMLSLREFCTALYLMERYREGRPFPAVLPSGIGLDELFPTAGQPATAYRGATWQPSPGFQQQQGIPGMRPITPATGLKAPPQIPVPPQADGAAQSMQPKSRVPVLEKHLVNQLSKEEQSALNSKFQDATEADKKVEELEKEILDSKEKIEFYRTKMQELVLYKSRCDNRLNEITERASADRREAESLAKKYEEKYKQVGDVASKLTIEEATFRDVQERKMELYNAIVKMEQGGSADGLLQVRADRIQSDLEELVKGLNERCKKYGLRVKPTALVELPFGWQPGIQEGAADWDEDWDKFEDEGFMVVKELTVDVENVVLLPKPPKSTTVWNEKAPADDASTVADMSPSNADGKLEKPLSTSERVTESGSAYAPSEDDLARSPSGSPMGRSALESPSQEFPGSHFGTNAGANASPRGKESHSDHGGAEASIFGDKYVDDSSWGPTFDTNDDTDSIWGFNTKDSDHENRQHPFFGSGELGLTPIRTDSPGSMFPKEKSPFFADSVPSTPLFNSGSPPTYSQGSEEQHFFDNSSRFDSFSMHSRFDSFNMHDSGLFAPRESLARFDSIRSTTDQSHGFPSFDDSDPFSSSGPFKSLDSQTPKRGSDGWSAF